MHGNGLLGGNKDSPLMADFLRPSWHGAYTPDDSYLAYPIEGFFENGGQRCTTFATILNLLGWVLVPVPS